MLAVLGLLPSAQPVPVYLLLITLGALVTCLAYLIGLAVNWKRLTRELPSKNKDINRTSSQENQLPENQNGDGDELTEDHAAEIIVTWNLLNPP